MRNRALLGLLGCGLMTGAAFAQNDTCAGALPVELGVTVNGSFGPGAAEGPVCNGQTHSTGGAWYTITGNGHLFTAALCGTSFDTRLTIYSATDGCGTLTCVDGNDDSCGLQSSITYCAASGTVYYILVHGYGAATGAFVLNVNAGASCAPPENPWAESDDAGSLPSDAQVPIGSGTLGGISGTFDGSDVDMYLISICDYENFSASTVRFTSVDTQLFLFNSDGTGVAANDDEVGGTTLQSTLTNAYVPANGNYYLAVSRYNIDPVDSDGALLWANTFRVEHAPDGPGAANPVAAWTGVTTGTATYLIALSGACYPGGGCPPCAADFNQDGGVDGGDVESFFTAWEGGEGCGDVNQDGGVDGGDVEAFYTVWEAGGC